MGCHHGHGPCLEFPSILWLSGINECWKRQRFHIAIFFGCNFVCHMTYLLISPQGKAQCELSYRDNLRQTVEYKNHTNRKIIMYKNPHSNLPNDRHRVCAQWVVSCRSIGFTPHLFNNHTDQKVLGQLWLPRLWMFCILWWYSAKHW